MSRLTERNFKFTSDYVKSSLQSWSIAQALKKLQEYENKEEDGLLVSTPCKIGDTVYVISACENVKTVLDGNYDTATGYYCPFELSNLCPHDCDDCNDVKNKLAVFEDTICYIGIDEMGVHLFTENTGMCCTLGRDAFFTEEEAQKALKGDE